MTGQYKPGIGFEGGDPRLSMARALMQQGSSTAPVQSPLEGIARALQGGLGGYLGGQAKQSKADAMTAALTALGDQSIPADQRLQASATAYGDKDSFGDNPMMAALLQARVQALMPKEAKSDIGKVMQDMNQLPIGDPNRQSFLNWVEKNTGNLPQGMRRNDKGVVEEIPGFGATSGAIKKAESTGTAQGTADVKQVMEPKLVEALAGPNAAAAAAAELAKNPALISRAGGVAGAQGEVELRNAGRKAFAAAQGTEAGQAAGQGDNPFRGNGIDAQALNALVRAGRLTKEEAAMWASGKTAIGPNGQLDFVLPQGGGQPPASPGAAPVAGGPAPAAPMGLQSIRAAQPKDIPANIQTGMLENVNSLKKVNEAIAALTANPSATGLWKGIGNAVMPGDTLNMWDPKGAEPRALLSDIGSLKIHDRSGANVTVSESPRLKPFVPQVGDDPKTVMMKLKNFRREYESMLRDQSESYGPDAGYRPNPAVSKALGGAPVSRETPAETPGGAVPKLTPDAAGIAAFNKLPSGSAFYDENGVMKFKP